MSTFFKLRKSSGDDKESGAQMSFLEHLDELRRRIIRCVVVVFVVFLGCWFVSDYIYNFLAVPVRRALAEAGRVDVPISGRAGNETIAPLNTLKDGDKGRYIFAENTKLGTSMVPAGATVAAIYTNDAQGRPGLFTDEPIFAGNTIIPKGVKLPIDFTGKTAAAALDDKLIVTTAIEPFSLYVKVSLYAALAVSIPFLLWQIWGFVSPGLYPHERAYVTPFIGLSSVSFVVGAAFAYYVIFPPAAKYLLGLGTDFKLLLKADDYFDFIILVMLAMGLVFQMPAITYVLARIGLVTARWMIKIWRISLVVILVVAAVISPTNDIPNMMLFAAPMLVLYVISIFIAWGFGKKRTTS
ncbi:MAG: twin-arginine translocase subunit TatC [Pyrinomonadaceae bacterium]